MTPEKILEIARRYTAPQEESSLLVEFNSDDVPTPTGETLNMMMWNFCEEELIAFAKSVIEEARKSEDWPVLIVKVPVEIFAKLRKHKVSVDDLVDAIKQVDGEKQNDI